MAMLLLLVIGLPVAGAGVVLLVARFGARAVRTVSAMTVLATCVISVLLAAGYDPAITGETWQELFQFRVNFPAGSFGGDGPPRVALGVDGISVWLLVTTCLLMVPAVVLPWRAGDQHPAGFHAVLLLGQASLLVLFAAVDVVLFVVLLEASRMILFMIVGKWGGTERRAAAKRFFVFTYLGGGLILSGLVLVVLSHSRLTEAVTFSIPQLLDELPLATVAGGSWAFWLLLVGFAIHVPLFPLHVWFEGADMEASTAGSVLLSGIWIKVGGYGVLRFVLPLGGAHCWEVLGIVAGLGVVGFLYNTLRSVGQRDLRRLLAGLSAGSCCIAVGAMFSLNSAGFAGGLLQMLNHALAGGLLIVLVGLLVDRYRTAELEGCSGLAGKLPVLSGLVFFGAFSLMGIPGLAGFPALLLMMSGLIRAGHWYVVAGLVAIVLTGWSLVGCLMRAFLGPLREPELNGRPWAPSEPGSRAAVTDLTGWELATVLPLVGAILWLGLWPQPLLDRAAPSLEKIAATVRAGKTNETVRPKITRADSMERRR